MTIYLVELPGSLIYLGKNYHVMWFRCTADVMAQFIEQQEGKFGGVPAAVRYAAPVQLPLDLFWVKRQIRLRQLVNYLDPFWFVAVLPVCQTTCTYEVLLPFSTPSGKMAVSAFWIHPSGY